MTTLIGADGQVECAGYRLWIVPAIEGLRNGHQREGRELRV